jgi:hypothetical protein
MTDLPGPSYECTCGDVADEHDDEGSAPCLVDGCPCIAYEDTGDEL